MNAELRLADAVEEFLEKTGYNSLLEGCVISSVVVEYTTPSGARCREHMGSFNFERLRKSLIDWKTSTRLSRMIRALDAIERLGPKCGFHADIVAALTEAINARES